MRQYNFDEIIDRKGTNSINVEAYGEKLLQGAELPWKEEDIIRMWVADMEFAVPEVILEAMRKRIDQKIFGYTGVFDSNYYDAFVAWNKKRYGWEFPEEHLVFSPGIVPALLQLPTMIMEPDEKILIMTPSYGPFKTAGDFNRREVVYSPLINKDNFYRMDFDDLREKAADPKTTVCILCNPHNPTGRAWSKEELKIFADIMRKENMWVISDEIHGDLLRLGLRHIPLATIMGDYSRLITCMAPSKTFNLAALMVSNLIIPDEKLRTKWNNRTLVKENALGIVAAQAAYSQGEDWLKALQAYLDENFRFAKEFFDKHLPLTNFKIPEATYLAWVDLGPYLPEDLDNTILFFAEKAGVILEDESMFVQDAKGFVRLNFACPKAMLKEGLERIRRALTEE